jgi:methylthioribose-1-phosphate isomerase
MKCVPTEPIPPASAGGDFSPFFWRDGAFHLLDQTLLPEREVWVRCTRPEEVADAIRRLAVRGAPAIGVAAAYGLALGTLGMAAVREPARLTRRFDEVSALLGATRPTAVNLRWALERGRRVFERARLAGAQGAGTEGGAAEAGVEQGAAGVEQGAVGAPAAGTDEGAGGSPAAVAQALLAWARELHARDIATNRRIGRHGAPLFSPGARVLTHCNTGALATAGYGTALGVIQSAWSERRLGMVWVDETRPLLQGARLTAWELRRLGIPFRLVTDSSAGTLMAQGLVDRIVVGADRIAANGDTANKIGTYPLAVLAQRHRVPFYVAAPLSTIDLATPDGGAIPIEERAPGEVTEVFGRRIAPDETAALNFAFDVTPHELITAIVTEEGVLAAPYGESIAAAFARQPAEEPGM